MVNGQDHSALQSLISPVSLEDFHKEFWPDQAFVVHGDLARLGPPFTDPLLADFRALSARYFGRILFGRGGKGPKSVLIQNVDANDLYEMGLSLYLPDLEPVLAGASKFLRDLEVSLGLATGEARITAWASPSSDGIACHFDAEEVFSIQLLGAKRFFVAETRALVSPVGAQFGPGIPPNPDLYLQAAEGFPDPKDFEFTQIDMKPGSVLYVPRGMWHRTEADEDSLSISVILSPASTADAVLGQLRSQLLQDPNWRRPVSAAVKAEGLDQLLKTLPDVVRAVRASDLRPNAGPGGSGDIGADSRFQRVPGEHFSADAGGEADAPAESGPATLQVPTSYGPVITWLNESRAAFSVADLLALFPDVSIEGHQAVLPRLVERGFLRWLWFRPLVAAPAQET